MKPFLLILTMAALLLATVGCSDDEANPTSSGLPQNTTTTTWDESGGFWRTSVDATSYADFAHFSFESRDTISGSAAKAAGSDWDIAFRREVIKLDGGASTIVGGDAVGADLGVVDFAAVTLADTAGVTWVNDAIDYFIDNWYSYDTINHVVTANQYVYSMVDAGGHNYLKFRVDSMPDADRPPTMGEVYITYLYQTVADLKELDGTAVKAMVDVGDSVGYFDFSTGQQVYPADPADSPDWDIAFASYDCSQNSGPNGTGACKAFPAGGELADSTDIDVFTMQPNAPMFPDIPSSALTDWYNYNDENHQLTSKSHVYLVKTAGKVYKLRIDSYYANKSGLPVSANYTFIWKAL